MELSYISIVDMNHPTTLSTDGNRKIYIYFLTSAGYGKQKTKTFIFNWQQIKNGIKKIVAICYIKRKLFF